MEKQKIQLKAMNKTFLYFCIFVFLLFPRLSFSNQDAQNFYDQAKAAYDSGDKDQATNLFEKAIEADSGFAPAYTSLGLIYLDNNAELDDIIWLFDTAANLDPKNPENYSQMCRAYFQNQKFDWAESACLKTLSVDENFLPAKLTLAWVYLSGISRPGESIKYFNQVLEKTQNPRLYWGLGMAYAQNNEKGKVLEIVTLLRQKGEEKLATQLEKMIRPIAPVLPPVDYMPGPVATTPSTVVRAQPEPEPDPSELQPNNGVQKVKLKGKISIVPKAETSQPTATAAKNDGDNDESGLGDMEGSETSSRQRIEKLRQLRGPRRSGHANGSLSLTGSAAGSGTVAITGK